jgi:hypothetical protein
MERLRISLGLVAAAFVIMLLANGVRASSHRDSLPSNDKDENPNSERMFFEGRNTFRFDTFGDEDFWGGTLGLHKAIEGSRFGGVGAGISPRVALGLGLKVDVDALPPALQAQIKQGRVNLDDPAVTLALLKLNSVVGLTGFFQPNGSLKSVGIQCALCHSSVDNSLAPGIGHRLDGWANRDLNVGAIVAAAPNLQPVADLLTTDVATVQTVLRSWGPGKFDAELLMDGKASNPQQVTDGTVTGTNVSGAALIPPAFGLAGVNLHTWTGWGSVPYWNAFVANLEMHGKGTFFDSRLDNADQFPIAAANHFGHVVNDPDLISPKLPALHFYQLALAAPAPPNGTFQKDAANNGSKLFDGKAKCSTCHVVPTASDPGWNLHKPSEVCVDSFQADRAPDHEYRTAPLNGLWTHTKGGFYHDGRFPTLLSVVNHYDSCMSLGLSSDEKSDLVEYLKSLPGTEGRD